MATLYTYTFEPGAIEGASALPATFTPSITPGEGATYATISSITTMILGPAASGTYNLVCKVKGLGGVWSDWSYESVVQNGEGTHIVTFDFPNVDATISGNKFEFYMGKLSGPPRTVYVAIDDTSQYFIVTGDWAGASGEEGPEKPINPTPADAASDVTLDQDVITWEDGGGADTYNVYYGDTSGSLILLSAEQAGLSFTIAGITLGSPFNYLVTRYWRIDAKNDDGVTEGDEWSFVSISFDPPATSEDAEGNLTGINNMITIKRLVVAANSKIWVEDI